MRIALRTQQVIADETRVASVVDPLGGSWYVESLTNDIEAAVMAFLRRVDEMGGTIAASRRGGSSARSPRPPTRRRAAERRASCR